MKNSNNQHRSYMYIHICFLSIPKLEAVIFLLSRNDSNLNLKVETTAI